MVINSGKYKKITGGDNTSRPKAVIVPKTTIGSAGEIPCIPPRNSGSAGYMSPWKSDYNIVCVVVCAGLHTHTDSLLTHY